MKYPASWWGAKWREALPTGNGVIGAAVYGAVKYETILLTHDDLWHEVVTPEFPDVSGKLGEIRRLLMDNKASQADGILSQALKDAGYKADIGAPLPLGDLKVATSVKQGFTNYRRSLDMTTGEVSVRWNDGETSFDRRIFVSRADDCIVMKQSCSGPDEWDIELTLDLHDRDDSRMPDDTDPKLPEALEVESDTSGIIRYAARNDDGTDFGAVARITTETGTVSVIENGIRITGSSEIQLVMKLFVKGQRRDSWDALQTWLESNKRDYNALLNPHVALHGELFNRVALDLGSSEGEHLLSNEELLLNAYQGEVPTSMVEKMWAYGRYLLISSSRAGGQPCPLQGKWCGSYRGYWTFNMTNENLQMNYWQAMSGNLTETLLPVFDYFDRLMDDFRENARKLYGCRGILVSCITTPPSGLFKDIQPHILHWTGAGAWVGQHYYDYYLHTGDVDFLRNRALPFLREVALFYEDFFTIGEDGYYLSAPSNSPENTPGNYQPGPGGPREMETNMNATMDFALAKEVLTHLIEGSRITGQPDDTGKWEQMLKHIPPYQINEDGAVSEWMHPFYTDHYNHRHQSHLYPIFPGTEITRESDPDLFEAFEIALRKRLEIGIGAQSNWSFAHMANIYARIGEGDDSLNCLSLLSRSCVMNNFFTTSNDWRCSGIGLEFTMAPFQIDANLGWSAAIQEMLLFSLPGKLRILPALPSKWKKGSVRGLLARGGVEVSIDWDMGASKVQAVLRSTIGDQVVELSSPFLSQPLKLELKAGSTETCILA